MILKQIALQNFRSYSKASFDFSPGTTIIVGKNTAGKSNLIEAISLLSTGKSFRSEKDRDLFRFGTAHTWAKGKVEGDESIILEARFVKEKALEAEVIRKKYLVNNIPKRRVDFAQHLPTVLFSPLDLDIVSGSPGQRRRFLNDVLEQTDREYALALYHYEKSLRQRNALLDTLKRTGIGNEKQFAYWDELVIHNGGIITAKREALINVLNEMQKDIFSVTASYDKSVISKERLMQYKDANEPLE